MSDILRPKDYDLIVGELSESESRIEAMRHIESCANYYAPKNYYFYTMLSEALARKDDYNTESDIENYFINNEVYSDDLSEYADSPNKFLRFSKVYADFLDYNNELVELNDDYIKAPTNNRQTEDSDLKVIADALRKLLGVETVEETTIENSSTEIVEQDRCDEFHSFKSSLSAEKLPEVRIFLENEKIIDGCDNNLF